MRSWLSLLRISLAPSAAADAVAGLVFAHGGFPTDARAWWLVPASLGVYHGAVALNDWNDREHDARTRPARPIPCGAVSPRAALAAGATLVLAGVACAVLASPAAGAWMGGVALLAVLYDVAGRGPILGPVLLALCRAGNLAAGSVLAHAAGDLALPLWSAVLPALLYGLYVGAASRLGRLEDGEDARAIGARPRQLLVAAAALLFAFAFLPAAAPTWARLAALALAAAGALGLSRTAFARADWTRGDVERAMGLVLRRLLIATAIVALLGGTGGRWDGALAAAAILSGFPLGYALRRACPPS